MSVDQIVVGIAGAVCIAGAVTAVAHRDPRTAGVAFAGVLLGLAVLYAGLAAPAVAAAVIVVALFSTLPFVVHLTVATSRATSRVHASDRPRVTGVALVLGATLLALLAGAIALGEVPVNVSVRSADGYDLAALGDLLAGRAAVAASGALVVLLAALIAARAARHDRRSLR